MDMKIRYMLAASVVAFGLTACTDDYTDWADPQSNAEEDAIDAITGTFTATDADLDGLSADDLVAVVSVGELSTDEATFSASSLSIDGTDVEFTYEDGVFYVTAYTLDNLIRETYGSRACVARSFTIKASGAATIDEQGLSVSSDEMDITITPQATPDIDSNGYYLLGNFSVGSWDLTAPVWMEEVSEGVYTATVTSTSSECWYKFYEGSYYDSSDWDTVNLGQLGCETNGDESLSGFIVWNDDAITSGGVQTPVIPSTGTFTVTIDMINMTYTVESVDPETWYLVGSCIGDGSWSTGSVDCVGVSLYPMAATEDGICSYTGYFTTDGFKLIKEVDSWDYQWGYSDGYVKNDGSSGNITVSSEGYYTVTLDYQNDVLSIEPYTATVTEYEEIGVSGDFNSWGYEAMTLCTGSTHLWQYEISSDTDTTLKFLVDGWSPNWGAEDFPSGAGVNNGANIPVTAGSYIVIFNDIDGGYTFISK